MFQLLINPFSYEVLDLKIHQKHHDQMSVLEKHLRRELIPRRNPDIKAVSTSCSQHR